MSGIMSYLIAFCSVAQSCLTLCDPMDCSTPDFPVLYRVPEFAQTHVHWVGDAIQTFCPLLPFSPFAFNLSQYQEVFQWVRLFTSSGQSIGVSASASVLPMNIQGWFPLGLTGLISLLFKELSRVFSSTTVQKHQFFGTYPFLWFSSHMCTWLWINHSSSIQTFVSKVMSLLFNMLSRLVIAFLPRSKRLLISWLQSPSAVILEP